MSKKNQIPKSIFKPWWLPTINCCLLLMSFILFLTFLFYTGEKHRQLASRVETNFIKKAFSRSSSKRNTHNIYTVDITIDDITNSKGIIERNFVHNIYTEVFIKALAINSRYIIFNYPFPYQIPFSRFEKLLKELS